MKTFSAACHAVSRLFVALTSLIFSPNFLRNVSIFFKTLPRDLRLIWAFVEATVESLYNAFKNETVISIFQNNVRRYPGSPCFLFEDQIWTFRQVDEYSTQVANYFSKKNFKKGDVVALFMTNRPEFIGIWIGLAKIGVITSFINTNLKAQPLLHCLNIVHCKGVIFSNDLAQAIQDVRESFSEETSLYELEGISSDPSITCLQDVVDQESREPKYVKPTLNQSDHLIYIYTSGTTGLPKAAVVPHSRYILSKYFLGYIIKTSRKDRLYNCLPLYHTAGGLLGCGAPLLLGASMVIRSKFSASNYFPDCVKYKCTMGQYIGEMCRYLLSTPDRPCNSEHSLRVLVGNGMSMAIWKKFSEKFNIPEIAEMYASTESNVVLANIDGKVGAVGYIPRFFPFTHYMGVLVKVDPETHEVLRGKDGLCIRAGLNEGGMMVGLIPKFKNSIKAFHGYVSKKESSRKYVYDVVSKGDSGFLTGDLMSMDEEGYVFFKDRTGDTFRWKGENVSTTEVENVISSVTKDAACVVYGVQVGDLEGRAGMAAIADPTRRQVDLQILSEHLDKSLPKYARPLFIRIMSQLEMTGTYKLKKINLQKEGFNPSVVSDQIYFKFDSNYSPLTPELYNQIMSGKIKL